MEALSRPETRHRSGSSGRDHHAAEGPFQNRPGPGKPNSQNQCERYHRGSAYRHQAGHNMSIDDFRVHCPYLHSHYFPLLIF